MTLFDSGEFQFDYGSGNQGVYATVGFFSGNGFTDVPSQYHGLADLGSVNSVHWSPAGLLSYLDIHDINYT